jgi:hypothetical protein
MELLSQLKFNAPLVDYAHVPHQCFSNIKSNKNMNNITKITLTKVYVSDKNKDGTPLMSKLGKPYSKMSVKCVEHGDKWLSGFKGRENEFWKEGDQVDVIIKQNGEYLNYEVPKAEDKLAMKISAIEVDVMNLKNAVAKLGGAVAPAPTSAPSKPAVEDEPPF